MRDSSDVYRAPRDRSTPIALLLAAALACGTALAHELKVFAFADGRRVEGSAYAAGGGRAAGVRIIVKDAAGAILEELEPTPDGGFSFEAHAPVDHLIVAESSDGHRAEWRLAASELAAAFPAEGHGGRQWPTAPPHAHTASPGESGSTSAVGAAGPWGGTLDPTLEAAIGRAVARQVRPLREELISMRDAVRFHDIIGGIGYILGLVGLALWWHSRGTGKRQ